MIELQDASCKAFCLSVIAYRAISRSWQSMTWNAQSCCPYPSPQFTSLAVRSDKLPWPLCSTELRTQTCLLATFFSTAGWSYERRVEVHRKLLQSYRW